jgi:hypothetical protein
MIPGYLSCLPSGPAQQDTQASVDALASEPQQDATGDNEPLVGGFYEKFFGSSTDKRQSLPDNQDSDDDDDDDEEEDDSVLDVIENHPGKAAATIVGVGLLAVKLYSMNKQSGTPSGQSTGAADKGEATVPAESKHDTKSQDSTQINHQQAPHDLEQSGDQNNQNASVDNQSQNSEISELNMSIDWTPRSETGYQGLVNSGLREVNLTLVDDIAVNKYGFDAQQNACFTLENSIHVYGVCSLEGKTKQLMVASVDDNQQSSWHPVVIQEDSQFFKNILPRPEESLIAIGIPQSFAQEAQKLAQYDELSLRWLVELPLSHESSRGANKVLYHIFKNASSETQLAQMFDPLCYALIHYQDGETTGELIHKDSDVLSESIARILRLRGWATDKKVINHAFVALSSPQNLTKKYGVLDIKTLSRYDVKQSVESSFKLSDGMRPVEQFVVVPDNYSINVHGLYLCDIVLKRCSKNRYKLAAPTG